MVGCSKQTDDSPVQPSTLSENQSNFSSSESTSFDFPISKHIIEKVKYGARDNEIREYLDYLKKNMKNYYCVPEAELIKIREYFNKKISKGKINSVQAEEYGIAFNYFYSAETANGYKTTVAYARTFANDMYWQMVDIWLHRQGLNDGQGGTNWGRYQLIDMATSYSLPDNEIYNWQSDSYHVILDDDWNMLWSTNMHDYITY